MMIKVTDIHIVLESLTDRVGEITEELQHLQTVPENERWETWEQQIEDDIEALQQTQIIYNKLESGEWIVVDTAPKCFAVIDNERCTDQAAFAPVIVAMYQGQPVCQANREPPLIVCEKHAAGTIEDYFSEAAWRSVQEQASKALNGIVLQKSEAALMFQHLETGQLVPPIGTPRIALPR